MKNRNIFYTVPEAAVKFGVSRSTMSRWVATGKVKSVVTAGGHHRILRSEIDALLNQNGFFKSAAKTGKTILIVDDDELVRKTLKQQLTRMRFNVEAVSDGFKAGLKAMEIKPDLVVLDLKMEGIDGFEVCRTIKTHDSLKKTKILIMTGFDSAENRQRAMREGADGFLPKGGSFKSILKHINELLDR